MQPMKRIECTICYKYIRKWPPSMIAENARILALLVQSQRLSVVLFISTPSLPSLVLLDALRNIKSHHLLHRLYFPMLHPVHFLAHTFKFIVVHLAKLFTHASNYFSACPLYFSNCSSINLDVIFEIPRLATVSEKRSRINSSMLLFYSTVRAAIGNWWRRWRWLMVL